MFGCGGEDDAEPKRDAERSEMRSGQFHDGNRVSFFQVWPDNRGVRWEASVEPGSDKMTDGVWGGQYQNGRWTTGVGASRRFEATRECVLQPCLRLWLFLSWTTSSCLVTNNRLRSTTAVESAVLRASGCSGMATRCRRRPKPSPL